jgi:hypothetical protein
MTWEPVVLAFILGVVVGLLIADPPWVGRKSPWPRKRDDDLPRGQW